VEGVSAKISRVRPSSGSEVLNLVLNLPEGGDVSLHQRGMTFGGDQRNHLLPLRVGTKSSENVFRRVSSEK